MLNAVVHVFDLLETYVLHVLAQAAELAHLLARINEALGSLALRVVLRCSLSTFDFSGVLLTNDFTGRV